MRISWLEEKLSINGSIRRVVELSNRLIARGHEVTIYDLAGVPCRWIRSEAQHRKQAAFVSDSHEVVIFNASRQKHYDLMQKVDARLKVFYCLGMPERAKLPILKQHLTTPAAPGVFRSVLYSDDYLVLTNASWMHHWLKDELGLDTVPVVGGVNLDMFKPHRKDTGKAAYDLRASGDPRAHKGSSVVRQAARLIQAPSTSSGQAQRPAELSTYYGLNLPQSEMAAFYSEADVFLDAQQRAGWNNPVAEAMACGVPVVCTDIGGVEDFAFHNETALLVPVGDPQAMAEAALRLLQDKALRDRLRGNAYEVIKCFDWENTTTAMETALEARLSGGQV